jgi:hypothetical protein
VTKCKYYTDHMLYPVYNVGTLLFHRGMLERPKANVRERWAS